MPAVLVFRLDSVDLHIAGEGIRPGKYASKESKAEAVFWRYLLHSVGPFYPKEARQANVGVGSVYMGNPGLFGPDIG